jgi:hypothetical protein
MRTLLASLALLAWLTDTAGAQAIRLDARPGQYADGIAIHPAISFDGRYVAFVSSSPTLVAGDLNGHADFFRYDRTTAQWERGPIVAPLGVGEYPYLVAISHDGRWLLFNDLRGDWVPGDTNAAFDAFVYDFTTGAVERVSVATGGGQGNGGSFATSMTPDAHYVAFASEATTFGPAALDNGALSDVFVRDRPAGQTFQVSRGSAGGPADGMSVSPRLSPDGGWVCFSSRATNLAATPDRDGRYDAYLAHWIATETVRIAAPEIELNLEAQPTGLSWNAAYTAVAWLAPGGSGWHTARWDRLDRVARPVADSAPVFDAAAFSPARISMYGRYVVRMRREGSWPSVSDVLRIDDLTGGQSTILASGVEGEFDLSLDGRYVVYTAATFLYLQATQLPADGRLPSGDDDLDGLPNDWETQFGLDPDAAGGDNGAAGDPDHDGVTNQAELLAGTHPKALYTRYLAEGVENGFFETRLALLNYGAAAVAPLPGHSFSTTIEADVDLIVDRTTLWDRSAYGGHSDRAAPAPSTTWYFAEGSTAGSFDLFYLLENPNLTRADATVRWMLPPPLAPVVHTYVLPPLSRTTLYVDKTDVRLASTDAAAVIEATQPIVAERAMYWSRPGEPFAAGHGASGVVAPATHWYLAEGATGRFFETFILLLNPTGTTAACTVRYLLDTGDVLEKIYTLPAESRTTVWADVETFPGLGPMLANAAFATDIRVTNGVGIVVERAMWWPDGDWREAHASAGATAGAPRWAFADGDNASGRQTYVLLANTSAVDGLARMTLFFEDGTTTQGLVVIDAERRVTVDTGALFPSSAGRRFGALVEAMGATPSDALVVERVTYWNADDVFWGGGTGALASPIPF